MNTKLSPAQHKILANIERTAMYGQNIRTFDKLIKLGLIARTGQGTTPYTRTAAGDAALNR